MEEFYFVVSDEFIGFRLDKFITVNFSEKSRSHIQGVIDGDNVLVNGIIKKSNYKLKLGDKVTVVIPMPAESNITPENIKLNIIYEDQDLIVINKEKGMMVHPAPGFYSGTLVNALLYNCKDLSGINGVMRPGIVHRIDKDTSGVLVVAKNDFAHNHLAAQLKAHSMKREYIALVEGVIKSDSGTIDKPLARDPRERIKIKVIEGGRDAVTHFEVLKRFKTNTLIKCVLETGRTHQIRVHMTYIKHPLVGDPVYGFKKQRFNTKGQLLHARTLGFIHPRTNEYVEFESEIPGYFNKIVEIFKNELK